MTIDAERMMRDIEAIASFSEAAPEVGFSRPTFSEAWRKAVAYVVGEAKRAGCEVRVDAAGNVHARRGSWEEKVWLSGSHIDSVPTGGKFDGVVGVIAALEVLRADREAKLELVIFAEEEGTTFNLGMLGSRAWVGTLDLPGLRAVKNRSGDDYFAAGRDCGVSPENLAAERMNAARYRGFIEVHVEQGVAMWNSKMPVAVVTAINGRRQFTCTVTGAANHAGSTKMGDRADALAGAAEVITALETWGRDAGRREDHTVVTVGRIAVEPNALNVIAGNVTFYIDFRARRDETLEGGEAEIRSIVERISQRRGMRMALARTEALAAMPMNSGVCGRLREAAGRVGASLPEVASGALHDAAILAPLVPTAMLFVASEGGISHNPKEFSRIEDIVLATRILGEAVKG